MKSRPPSIRGISVTSSGQSRYLQLEHPRAGAAPSERLGFASIHGILVSLCLDAEDPSNWLKISMMFPQPIPGSAAGSRDISTWIAMKFFRERGLVSTASILSIISFKKNFKAKRLADMSLAVIPPASRQKQDGLRAGLFAPAEKDFGMLKANHILSSRCCFADSLVSPMGLERFLFTSHVKSVSEHLIKGGIHSPVFFMEDKQKCTETCFETVPLDISLASFSFARFIFGFAMPFTILIFTNYKIFQTTKRSNSLTCRQKAKVKYVAIAIIVIFLICFAPYHVVLIIRAIYFILHQDCPCPFENKIYPVFTVFLCLGTANSVADPIIYVLVSENIREDCYRSLRRWRRNSSKLNSSTDHNTDNIKLEVLKESEAGSQRKENKEIRDSSDSQKTCTTGRDQESGN
ncbi:hypothetical protein DUI87_24881 [Hirundo rustica rustica]|uniref:G-protein coupled receptors family 1 profile domain-containing protein n=1 Tax=Hirundo rustica rustica TaxID=333673 RepID=A0A3M0JI25_HIRRU|nr:hypothetical protein DUI87_24881 [Hirundo rustica rustica]